MTTTHGVSLCRFGHDGSDDRSADSMVACQTMYLSEAIHAMRHATLVLLVFGSGALRADLVPTKYLEIDRQPLPPVTVVFVAVIDADHLVHQKTGIAEAVHVALASVMQVLNLSYLTVAAAYCITGTQQCTSAA